MCSLYSVSQLLMNPQWLIDSTLVWMNFYWTICLRKCKMGVQREQNRERILEAEECLSCPYTHPEPGASPERGPLSLTQ